MRAFALVLLLGISVSAVEEDDFTLQYRGERGDELDVNVDFTLKLEMNGNQSTIDAFRASESFLRFEKIHMEGKGVRRILRPVTGRRAGRIHVRYDEATLDGVYDYEDYSFDFVRGETPDDLQGDKLQSVLWMIFSAGKSYRVEADGAVEFSDPNQDSTGEVMDIFGTGVIRFPAISVTEGAEWEKIFKTEAPQKDNKGRFELTQKSTLDKVADGKAHITTTFRGEIVYPEGEEPDLDGGQETENSAEAEVKTVFDIEKGVILSSESKGKIRFYFNAPNPGGDEDHDLEIILRIESKITPDE